MFRTWLTATAVTVVATATVLSGATAYAGDTRRASDERYGYGQAQLQHDLDTIHATGISGVLAEVKIGPRRLRGTSGVADLEAGGAVDVDGYFRMGSNTKTFVAVVVLQLVAEGRLSLDDTVQRWLPGVVTGNGNNGAAVTVRQLLQHTSGIHNYTDDLAARINSVEEYQKLRFESFTPRQLVAMAMAHEPDFAPGQGWNYSNTNYVLTGMIINKVTGRNWASEVHDRIIRPLGLRHTFAPGADTRLPRPHASAYLFLDRDTPIETADANLTWADAAGSLVSTASDLSRFWDAIGRGTLLPPAQQKQMRTTVLATAFQDDRPGLRSGLGLEFAPLTCGGGYWSHDGDVPGFTTRTAVSEDGRDTVVISISTSTDTPVDQAAWAMIDHALCHHA
jgi:D-alanyl-D-alanine carboxypeptidase